jgi:hypothetical protein
MSERLPLSKPELKKMFLRVMYEVLYGDMKGHSSGLDSIVPHWMNERFKIKMTKQEVQLTEEVIQELKNANVIVKNSAQSSDNFQVLTTKGKDIVEKQQDPDAYALRLERRIEEQ